MDNSGCSCTDSDGDGVSVRAGDCNDADASIYPGATEICGDEVDQDCDGRDKTKGCKKPGGGNTGGDSTPAEKCRNGLDDDGDGLADCADPDCASKPYCR